MEKTSRIYVAGHRGLVGSAILRRLLLEGYEHIITRTRKELDLTSQREVRAFFDHVRPEYVFLAAAKVGGIHANNTYPADFIRDNLLIESNVIDAAHRSGVKKILFLGSSCIYPRLAPQPLREEYLLTSELEPTNQWYAIAKIAGIKMCQAYRRQYRFSAICAMPTNLYGPSDNFDLETSHVLPALIRKFHLAKLAAHGMWEDIEKDRNAYGPIPRDILNGLRKISRLGGRGSVKIWGTGKPYREFLHVDDLATACLFLMDNYDQEDIINVGTGQDLRIRDLAFIVRAVVGFEGEISFDTERPDGAPRKLLDVSHITALGWRPKIPLEEGITSFYQWYISGKGADEGRAGSSAHTRASE
ncbi:GDP-L-fucose synthase family protein [Thermodesulfobacteriota bacterium]